MQGGVQKLLLASAPPVVGAVVVGTSFTDASTYNSGIASGIAADEYPFLILVGRAAANRTLSSVTFGGVAGSILHSVDIDTSGNATLLSFIRGPLGANGTISANYSGTMVRNGMGLYPVKGITDWTALDPTSVNGNSLNIDVPSNGIVFCAAYGDAAVAWTGLTDEWTANAESGNNVSGGYYLGPAETGRTISNDLASHSAHGIAAIGLA